jgi:hypothetical protein
MKRYLVFAGDTYYPEGGAREFHAAFDTVEDARDALVCHQWGTWAHVFDLETESIIDYLPKE